MNLVGGRVRVHLYAYTIKRGGTDSGIRAQRPLSCTAPHELQLLVALATLVAVVEEHVLQGPSHGRVERPGLRDVELVLASVPTRVGDDDFRGERFVRACGNGQLLPFRRRQRAYRARRGTAPPLVGELAEMARGAVTQREGGAAPCRRKGSLVPFHELQVRVVHPDLFRGLLAFPHHGYGAVRRDLGYRLPDGVAVLVAVLAPFADRIARLRHFSGRGVGSGKREETVQHCVHQDLLHVLLLFKVRSAHIKPKRSIVPEGGVCQERSWGQRVFSVGVPSLWGPLHFHLP